MGEARTGWGTSLAPSSLRVPALPGGLQVSTPHPPLRLLWAPCKVSSVWEVGSPLWC